MAIRASVVIDPHTRYSRFDDVQADGHHITGIVIGDLTVQAYSDDGDAGVVAAWSGLMAECLAQVAAARARLRESLGAPVLREVPYSAARFGAVDDAILARDLAAERAS